MIFQEIFLLIARYYTQTKVDLIEGVKKTYDYIKKKGTKDFNYRLNIEIDNDLTPETWKNKEI